MHCNNIVEPIEGAKAQYDAFSDTQMATRLKEQSVDLIVHLKYCLCEKLHGVLLFSFKIFTKFHFVSKLKTNNVSIFVSTNIVIWYGKHSSKTILLHIRFWIIAWAIKIQVTITEQINELISQNKSESKYLISSANTVCRLL